VIRTIRIVAGAATIVAEFIEPALFAAALLYVAELLYAVEVCMSPIVVVADAADDMQLSPTDSGGR
jgi:hypothetical protein